MTARRILHLMSGSIACAKATGLISAWVKAGHEVRVATTGSVERFVGRATLEGFSGHPVLSNAFTPGQVMDHVNLARWANLVVAAPATANLINKLAAGIADDAVTSLWQATWERGYPLVLVPAMNTRMWQYPATRTSIERLSSWGVRILPTAEGDLACGELGEGRMLEVDDILKRIDTLAEPASGRRVLITGGGTREAIDSVRYIGNVSTGRTAAALADDLAANGHQVHWLGASHAARPRRVRHHDTYVSFADLASALQRILAERDYDAVIHAAAVSDYSVARTATGKLPSGQELQLALQQNPKLIDRLREWSANANVRIVGFKLTDTADEAERHEAVSTLWARAGVDVVVHNDMREISDGNHPFTVWPAGGEPTAIDTVTVLGTWLHDWLEKAA